jgi:hypothetical protein
MGIAFPEGAFCAGRNAARGRDSFTKILRSNGVDMCTVSFLFWKGTINEAH